MKEEETGVRSCSANENVFTLRCVQFVGRLFLYALVLRLKSGDEVFSTLSG